MRKLLSVIAILLAFQNCQALPKPTDEVEIESQTKFEDDLREIVEFVKLQMQCGYPAAGIPPLAPYHADFTEFKVKTNDWDLSGNFTDFTVTGLNEFDVVQLTWNNVLHKIRYDFKFGELFAQGSYLMDAITSIFGPALKVYGDGLFHLRLEQLRVRGSFILRPNLSGGLRVQKFKINMDLGAVESKTTGFMNSKLYSRIFNNWVEEFLQILIDDNEEEVSAILESLIAPPMNKAMKNVSLVELLALIFGLVNDVIPTEPMC